MTTLNSLREDVLIDCDFGTEQGFVKINALQLAKRTIIDDNDREFTIATEYRLLPDDEKPVHRSAHITLKIPAAFADSAVGGVGQAT